eukprot:ctg_63.g21
MRRQIAEGTRALSSRAPLRERKGVFTAALAFSLPPLLGFALKRAMPARKSDRSQTVAASCSRSALKLAARTSAGNVRRSSARLAAWSTQRGAASGGHRVAGGAHSGVRWTRFGQDPRAHLPHRLSHRSARRGAEASSGGDVHQQGGQRDEVTGADAAAAAAARPGRRRRLRAAAGIAAHRHLSLHLRARVAAVWPPDGTAERFRDLRHLRQREAHRAHHGAGVSPGVDGNETVGDYERRVRAIMEAYQLRMREANALDFDDLLLECVNLLEQCPSVRVALQRKWCYILVDESQDSNRFQYDFVRLASTDVRSHLRVARRRFAPVCAHPRRTARLSGVFPGAELPQHRADRAVGATHHRAGREAAGAGEADEDALVPRAATSGGALPGLASGGHVCGDHGAVPRGGPQPRYRGGVRARRHPVPHPGRHALLRTSGDQGHAGVPATAGQRGRRGEFRAGDQHAAARSGRRVGEPAVGVGTPAASESDAGARTAGAFGKRQRHRHRGRAGGRAATAQCPGGAAAAARRLRPVLWVARAVAAETTGARWRGGRHADARGEPDAGRRGLPRASEDPGEHSGAAAGDHQIRGHRRRRRPDAARGVAAISGGGGAGVALGGGVPVATARRRGMARASVADDAARQQGIGVCGGMYRRRGGRHPAALSVPRRAGPHGRGTAAVVRGGPGVVRDAALSRRTAAASAVGIPDVRADRAVAAPPGEAVDAGDRPVARLGAPLTQAGRYAERVSAAGGCGGGDIAESQPVQGVRRPWQRTAVLSTRQRVPWELGWEVWKTLVVLSEVVVVVCWAPTVVDERWPRGASRAVRERCDRFQAAQDRF